LGMADRRGADGGAIMTRKDIYQISYQLGGTGSTHRKLSAAIRAMHQAQRRADRGGDEQGIGITAITYPADGTDPWGLDRPLTDAEMEAIQS